MTTFLEKAKDVLKPGAPGDLNSHLLDDEAYDAEKAQLLEKLNHRKHQALLVEDFERRRAKMTYKERFIDQGRRELQLLKPEWPILLFAAFWVYIHSVATNWVYYLYDKNNLGDFPPLNDAIMFAFGKLPDNWTNIGDYLFYVMMVCVVSFVASCFFWVQKGLPVFVVNVVSRLGVLVTISETFRMFAFLSTRLPGPSDHCRSSSPDYNPPKNTGEIWSRIDAFEGCGDLIFSSHTLIVLTCALVFHYYCKVKIAKIFTWFLVALLSILVIVAHRHYTVDIVVGWWTVPLVWYWYWGFRPDPPFPVLPSDPKLGEAKSSRLNRGSSLDSLGDNDIEAQLEAKTRSPKVLEQRAGSFTRSNEKSVMLSTDADAKRADADADVEISLSESAAPAAADEKGAEKGTVALLVADAKEKGAADSGAGDSPRESGADDVENGTGDSDGGGGTRN